MVFRCSLYRGGLSTRTAIVLHMIDQLSHITPNLLDFPLFPCKCWGPIWVDLTPWLHQRKCRCLPAIGQPSVPLVRLHDFGSGLRVPSSESFKPDNSPSRKGGHAEDSVHTTQTQKNLSSGRIERRDAQHVYEAEEADRKARGLKPHAIVCDSMGLPDETGRLGSRIFEVLKVWCTIFLDLSIIKAGLQDLDDYASLREEVE